MTAIRAGFAQGRIELRQSFTGTELPGQLLWPVATLVAMFLLRHHRVAGSGVGLGTLILPGVMGMFVALGAFLVVQQLSTEREDGTLLRAKATPNGIRGYLIGKFVTASGTVLAYLAILLIPGLFVLSGLTIDGARTWLTLIWVGLLGLLATQSVGALLGSLISGPRGAGLLSLPILALIAISGIFYPIVALPGWVQWVAQAFPVYWLGLGMRSALLPAGAVAVEIGGSWRPVETLLALGSWAVAGLILAPIVLRRTARKESGSALAGRRARTQPQ